MRVDEMGSEASARMITRADEAWEGARHFHAGSGDPDAIVQARSVEDVVTAVRWASLRQVPITVIGGGHSAWGTVPGGLTLDVSGLRTVEVVGDLVRIGGGATWGAVADILAGRGLGISSGDTASVGVGGLTLGGGIGWMVRAWGLAADQLVGAQVVAASGDVVEVTAQTHPELMWALRGGGGNFGVVTRFDFRAHALDAVVFAACRVVGDKRAALRAVRELMRDAPRELTVTYMDVPPMDPSAPAGAGITAVWAEPDEEAARDALAPLLARDDLVFDSLAVARYPDILLDMPAADPSAPPPGFAGGNALLAELGDEAVDELVSFRERHPASVLLLRSLGGAYADVAQEDTPFPARDATWFAMAGAFDLPGVLDVAGRADALRLEERLDALGCGFYGNFTTSTDAALAAKVFPPPTMARLAAVKREWDPQNLFRRNHNVLPA
ncbi:FAD-binding oxidoreductase [Microbacterium lacus]